MVAARHQVMPETLPHVDAPLVFHPLLKERVWGGSRLRSFYGRPLPDQAPIGESWEVVDRADEQSVVATGPLEGETLGALWTRHREELFGRSGVTSDAHRHPVLIKLLDARETLSVQVHPPAHAAAALEGEPKSEAWLITAAEDDAYLYAGLRRGVTREAFTRAIRGGGDITPHLHRVPVAAGDALVIPSGRVHAIGAGCLILEVQQNSDTTYRVHDFGRMGLDGRPRELHVDASLESIDFDDVEPALVRDDRIIDWPYFGMVRRRISGETPVAAPGEAAWIHVADGPVVCGVREFGRGDLFLVAANWGPRTVAGEGSVVVITLPGAATTV